MIQQDAAGGGGHGAQAGTVSASPAVKLSFNRASAVFSHPEAGWPGDGSTGNQAQGPGMLPGSFAQQPNAVDGNLSAVVRYAYAGLGHSYVWGGTSFSNGWDCSGFVQWAYAQAGIALPRVSQWAVLTPTTTPSPGDLVTQRPDGPNHWAHVGIYVGDGMMISALNPDEGTVLHSVGPEGTSWFFTTNASAGAGSPDSMPAAWQPPPVQAAPGAGQTRPAAEARNSGAGGDGAGNGKSAANRTNASAADNDRSNSGGNSSRDTREGPARHADRQDDRQQANRGGQQADTGQNDRNDRHGDTRQKDQHDRQGETRQKDRSDQEDQKRQEPGPKQTTDESADKLKVKGGSQSKEKGGSQSTAGSGASKSGTTDPRTNTGVPATGNTSADDSGETSDSEQTGPSTAPTENEDAGMTGPEESTEAPSTSESAPEDAATADLSTAVVNAAVNQTGLAMDPSTFIETVLQHAGYPPVDGPRDYLQLGEQVTAGEALPGDLLYYPGTDGQPPTVAVYLGNETGLQGSAEGGPVAEFIVPEGEVTPVYIRVTVQP